MQVAGKETKPCKPAHCIPVHGPGSLLRNRGNTRRDGVGIGTHGYRYWYWYWYCYCYWYWVVDLVLVLVGLQPPWLPPQVSLNKSHRPGDGSFRKYETMGEFPSIQYSSRLTAQFMLWTWSTLDDPSLVFAFYYSLSFLFFLCFVVLGCRLPLARRGWA